jgi:hypothetical protein
MDARATVGCGRHCRPAADLDRQELCRATVTLWTYLTRIYIVLAEDIIKTGPSRVTTTELQRPSRRGAESDDSTLVAPRPPSSARAAA